MSLALHALWLFTFTLKVFIKMQENRRPMPPADMGAYSEELGTFSPSFVPAMDMPKWALETFIDEDAILFNPDHEHLLNADIAFMWAASGFESKMRRVIGQCEELVFRCNKWQKGRQEQQIFQWFGRHPDWLITLDAGYCRECSDEEFCALVEHELYHIGQEMDGNGSPKFKRDGNPSLKIRGHDVEEFVGIVERYGTGTKGGNLDRMVTAGNSKPTVARVNIAHACGTCNLKVA